MESKEIDEAQQKWMLDDIQCYQAEEEYQNLKQSLRFEVSLEESEWKIDDQPRRFQKAYEEQAMRGKEEEEWKLDDQPPQSHKFMEDLAQKEQSSSATRKSNP